MSEPRKITGTWTFKVRPITVQDDFVEGIKNMVRSAFGREPGMMTDFMFEFDEPLVIQPGETVTLPPLNMKERGP